MVRKKIERENSHFLSFIGHKIQLAIDNQELVKAAWSGDLPGELCRCLLI
jgi:hypothetical protein